MRDFIVYCLKSITLGIFTGILLWTLIMTVGGLWT